MISRAFTYLESMFLLAKHWLSLSVAFSAAVGWSIYSPEFSQGIIYIFIGTFLMSGGAASLNQYQEQDLDKLMSRTSGRPIPAGLVSANQALWFAFILLFIASLLFALVGFYYALILGLANVVIYNLIYTNLKTKTQFAVLPGALVGAIPPMMGWTAAGGALIDIRLLYFALFMFLWQMPHFWLLMVKNAKDYQDAGFKVISNQINIHKVKILVFFWGAVTGIYLLAMPVFFKNSHPTIIILVFLLNILFIISFYRAIFISYDYSSSGNKAFILVNLFGVAAMIIFLINSFLGV
jgi:protoheme IX farnesyltransferase